MKRVSVLLLVLSLFSLAGMGVLTLIPVQTCPTGIKENIFSEEVMVHDSNGSLISNYDNYIDEHYPGNFNLTLPVWRTHRITIVDNNVSKIIMECEICWTLPDNHNATIEIHTGSTLSYRHDNHLFTASLPEHYFLVGGSISVGNKRTLEREVNRSTIESLNITYLDVLHEVAVSVECESSYSVNYLFTLDISLEYQTDMSPLPTPSISLMALGICAIVLFIYETENHINELKEPTLSS